MADFEDARKNTEEMFNNQENNTEKISEEQVTQTDNQSIQQEEQSQVQQVEDAANVAQAAAQAAAQRDAQLQQVMAENEQLRRANTELQDTITQQSNIRKEEILSDAMEMPILDVNRLAFEDDETVAAMQKEYAENMEKYVRQQVMKDVEPVMAYAKAGMREKERAEIIDAMKEIPELSGIDQMLPQLERIIGANKALQSDDIPLDEKYITAYAIAKGVDSINTPPKSEPTAEELMNYYEHNPEFQKLIEQKRLDDIKQSQQVPAMSASSGAVNAALNIQEKPKTWDDASKRTREMFGLDY